MKSNNISNYVSPFRAHRSYSVNEILAAGGSTAFGLKTGKNNDTLIKALENAAPAEPFTLEEWDNLMAQMANDK